MILLVRISNDRCVIKIRHEQRKHTWRNRYSKFLHILLSKALNSYHALCMFIETQILCKNHSQVFIFGNIFEFNPLIEHTNVIKLRFRKKDITFDYVEWQKVGQHHKLSDWMQYVASQYNLSCNTIRYLAVSLQVVSI